MRTSTRMLPAGSAAMLVLLACSVAWATDTTEPFTWEDAAGSGVGLYVAEHEADKDTGVMDVLAWQDGCWAFAAAGVGIYVQYDSDITRVISTDGYACGRLTCPGVGDAAGSIAIGVYDETDDERVVMETGTVWMQDTEGSKSIDEDVEQSVTFDFKKDHVYRIWMAVEASAASDPDIPDSSEADFKDEGRYYELYKISRTEPASGDFYMGMGGMELAGPFMQLPKSAQATLAVDFSSAGGYTGLVTAQVSKNFTDMAATLDQTYLNLGAGQTASTNLMLATDETTALGLHRMMVEGSDSCGNHHATTVWVNVVPEPATLCVLAVGAVLPALRRRAS